MATLPGQSTLILVSPGFLTITPEARNAESRIIDLAAADNITVSALDARGDTSRRRTQVTMQLADLHTKLVSFVIAP